jgi:hypothetical protein
MEPCVTPTRFMIHLMKRVFASHCTGFGIVRSSPVSGTAPGSKAIDAIEASDPSSPRDISKKFLQSSRKKVTFVPLFLKLTFSPHFY